MIDPEDPYDSISRLRLWPVVSKEEDATKAAKQDSSLLLPRALVENEVGMEGLARIKSAEGFCLVVLVPTRDWVEPVYRYLKEFADWDFREYRKGTGKYKGSYSDTSEDALSALTTGGRVLGVTSDLRFLPSSIVMNADEIVRLRAAGGRVVGAVIKAVTGTHPGPIDDSAMAGLAFDELAGCIRAGSTAQECLVRIERASQNKKVIDAKVAAAPHVSDLQGYGEAKTWALDLIADLDAWRKGHIEFDALRSRVVLFSKPGMGKSTFAKSVSLSTGCPLIATSVAQWFAESSGHLDAVIKKIDDAFDRARAASPAILFLDELDALPARDKVGDRNRDFWLPVITHMLLKLDSAISESSDRIVVIAATNAIDMVDSALLRPGRIDVVIEILPPDASELIGIIRHHLGGDLADADLTEAARLGHGGTGADVAGWVKLARARARRLERPVALSDLIEAIAPPDAEPVDHRRRVAIHEAGHAVVANALGLKVTGISVVAKGELAGHVSIKNKATHSRADVERIVIQSLSGRAAEEVFFSDPGLGAGGSAISDLAFATRLVGMLHLSTGSGANLLYRADPDDVLRALAIDPKISSEVEKELRLLYGKALQFVQERAPLVERVANELLVTRYIDDHRFEELVADTTLSCEVAANG